MATLTQASSASQSTSALPSKYFAFPESISPLPEGLKQGMYAPGTLGLLSVACCIGMLLFIIYRFLTWRAHYRTFVGYNQYVVLIINLLVADLLQGISFMFSFHWIYHDGIFAPTKTCFGQGFLLNAGDLASGCFVLGVAIHTFYGAVKGRHIKHSTFIICVICAWVFAIVMSALGPIQHGNHYYVRAGAWCWASPQYERERLAFHYIWIFIVQLGTIVTYVFVFLHLKNTLNTILPSTHSTTHAKVDRAAKLMLLFPASYLLLTLPLSAGRMWSMAHGTETLNYRISLAGGSMIGSSGIVDCLLYTLTRRALLKSNMQSSSGGSNGNGSSSNGTNKDTTNPDHNLSRLYGITQTRTVTINRHPMPGSRLSIVSSDDNADTISTRSGTSSSPQKRIYQAMDGRQHQQRRSSMCSLDTIMAVDPRKQGHKVYISTRETELDGSECGSDRSSIRSASPVLVMKGLAKLAKGSSPHGEKD